jgi:hypothetical protein
MHRDQKKGDKKMQNEKISKTADRNKLVEESDSELISLNTFKTIFRKKVDVKQ